MPLFDSSIDAIHVALDATTMRQRAIANNLANVNTPGFKRSDVTGFEDQLKEAVQASRAGDANAIKNLVPKMEMDETSTMRSDGNNVDVDKEMANLSENNVRYNALVQLAGKQMDMIKSVIGTSR
jgi:flagellar basal-body rod protein FlgB